MDGFREKVGVDWSHLGRLENHGAACRTPWHDTTRRGMTRRAGIWRESTRQIVAVVCFRFISCFVFALSVALASKWAISDLQGLLVQACKRSGSGA